MIWKTISAIENAIDRRTIECIVLAIEYANALGLKGEKVEKVTCHQREYGSDPIALVIEYYHSKKGKHG